MTKIDIFSGFLGAGKTTLIRKLLKEGYHNEKVVLIENEFGEIGIDGSFLQDAGVITREINSGCICCSLVGDFAEALKMVTEQYSPDRIIIEPSGVGKLSDIAAAVLDAGLEDAELSGLTTVVDASKCKIYMKNFGEFFNNQVQFAHCIILSRTGNISQDKLDAALALLREKNADAIIVTTPWDQLTGDQIMDAILQKNQLTAEMEELIRKEAGEHHHHHHHDHEHEHHHDHEHDHEHEHEHDHDHEHHHDHDNEHHHHHHDHDADEIFTSWGRNTAKAFTAEQIDAILAALDDTDKYGSVLRAKGIVACTDGTWIHFDYTPGEREVRKGPAAVTGMLCVIGAELKEDAVAELFGI